MAGAPLKFLDNEMVRQDIQRLIQIEHQLG